MYNLNGKVALVTGTAHKKGIGRGIALRLAKEGADVAVSDILTPDKLDPWDKDENWQGIEALSKEIKAMGRRSTFVYGDVTKSKDVAAIVDKVVKDMGGIDILVNNAGLVSRDLGLTPIVDLPEEIWNWGITTNLTGVFLVSKYVAKQMIKQNRGGKIISMSSRQGKLAVARNATYGATKAAVINLTQCLALELAPHKILANAICPGPVVSWGSMGKKIYEGMKKGLGEEEATKLAYTDASGKFDAGPLPGLVTVEDVANVAAFLASSESDYMTGQAINITGGRVMMR